MLRNRLCMQIKHLRNTSAANTLDGIRIHFKFEDSEQEKFQNTFQREWSAAHKHILNFVYSFLKREKQ